MGFEILLKKSDMFKSSKIYARIQYFDKNNQRITPEITFTYVLANVLSQSENLVLLDKIEKQDFSTSLVRLGSSFERAIKIPVE